MATPHVTGASRSTSRPIRPPRRRTATQALINNSTPNKVTNPGTGSPNRLLFSVFGGGRRGHDATHDVDHLAGERSDRERNDHGQRQRE